MPPVPDTDQESQDAPRATEQDPMVEADDDDSGVLYSVEEAPSWVLCVLLGFQASEVASCCCLVSSFFRMSSTVIRSEF